MSGEPSQVSPDAKPPRAGFFLNVVPAVLYVLAIFYGGSLEHPSPPDVPILPVDKLVHFFGFAGMQITVTRAVRYEVPRLGFARQLLVAALICSLLGAALELYQALLPTRSADVVDWVADTVGALTAAGVLWLVFQERRSASAASHAGERD
jgi:VanZ family protein